MTIEPPYCEICGEDHATMQMVDVGACDSCFVRECQEALEPILGKRWLELMTTFIERQRRPPLSPSHLQWCRETYRALADGGIWGLPACGLVFQKQGKGLVLVEQMPHDPAMKISPEDLATFQEREYLKNKVHFGAAGIPMRKGEKK